jgi:hypothetical protein
LSKKNTAYHKPNCASVAKIKKQICSNPLNLPAGRQGLRAVKIKHNKIIYANPKNLPAGRQGL